MDNSTEWRVIYYIILHFAEKIEKIPLDKSGISSIINT